jgi:putative oxidoreductase
MSSQATPSATVWNGERLHRWLLDAAVPFVGRILISAIFLISGTGKIADPAGTISAIQSVGLPLPPVSYGVAVVIEIVGGLALVVGYQTRAVALAVAGFCLATALSFHAHFGDQNQFIHFFKNLTMAGGLLQVFAFGAGRFSLDARRGQV